MSEKDDKRAATFAPTKNLQFFSSSFLMAAFLMLFTYGLVAFNGCIWLLAIWEGVRKISHQYRFSTLIDLIFLPIMGIILFVAIPILCRKRDRNALAFYTAFLGFLFLGLRLNLTKSRQLPSGRLS